MILLIIGNIHSQRTHIRISQTSVLTTGIENCIWYLNSATSDRYRIYTRIRTHGEKNEALTLFNFSRYQFLRIHIVIFIASIQTCAVCACISPLALSLGDSLMSDITQKMRWNYILERNITFTKNILSMMGRSVVCCCWANLEASKKCFDRSRHSKRSNFNPFRDSQREMHRRQHWQNSIGLQSWQE